MHRSVPVFSRNQPGIGLRAAAIGDDPPVPHPADQRLYLGMIDAHRCETVEGNVLDKGEEGIFRLVEGAVVIEVFGIDIGDDRYIGGKFEERAIAFVGLDHHPIASA